LIYKLKVMSIIDFKICKVYFTYLQNEKKRE